MAKKKDSAGKMSIDEFKAQFEGNLISPDRLVRNAEQILRTGSIKIDLMLRGGFRAGTISELYGPEGSAKSTIALSVAKEVLNSGGAVLYLDLERALDGGTIYETGKIKGWMEVIGVPPDHPNLVVARPGTGEEVYQAIEKAIISDAFDLIVLDSMAALLPRSDLEGEVGDSAYGKVAKLNSEALKRVLFAYDKQAVEKTHLMIINQARDTVGSTVKGMHSPGGRALRHFVRTKLKCTRIGKDAEAGVNTIRVRTDKNSFSPPWEEVDIYLHPNYGIDSTMELIEYGTTEGFILRAGSWLTLIDPATGEELGKVQGAEKLRALMESLDGYIDRLKEKLWSEGMGKLIKQGEPSGDEES
jgi:recombination protein RecA